MHFCKSFMKIRKSRGINNNICGTPIGISFSVDTWFQIIVCIEVSTLSSRTPPRSFFAKPPLKAANCLSPVFGQSPLYTLFFVTPTKNCSHPKKRSPPLSQQPPSKNWDPAKSLPLSFKKIGRSFNPPHKQRGNIQIVTHW